ncbi:unnamed protein product [Mytilus edulis]|uniref:HAT C-terminal dimerisation domain-containing protein n=1 Tax=Mytilus edulis TaxID=6550 RepID=A0A8S3PVJ5_MYTED|nr:unnamed protein product [Mytilus edulis]
MSKQPSKKRRITGPTFLTSWLEKSTPSSNCSQTDHENHHLEQSPELEIQPSPECTESQDGQTETSNPTRTLTIVSMNSENTIITKDQKKRKTGVDKKWLIKSVVQSAVRMSGLKEIETLAKHFKSVGSEIEVLEEWETLRTLLVKECKDMTFRKTMNKVASLGTLYPCLSKYAAIGLVLPVSTADCERCFSCLNRVKTCLRNRLCQKVLNCLMHISIEGPKEEAFDFDKCVVTFGKTNSINETHFRTTNLGETEETHTTDDETERNTINIEHISTIVDTSRTKQRTTDPLKVNETDKSALMWTRDSVLNEYENEVESDFISTQKPTRSSGDTDYYINIEKTFEILKEFRKKANFQR